MDRYQYVRPPSVDEAIEILQGHVDEAYVLAGGTALTLLIRQGLLQPGVLVDLIDLPGLRDVRDTGHGGLHIGPLLTLREIERAPLVIERQPGVASTLREVATVRVRNQATLGGNLAHADPAQDPPPALIALDASVEISGPEGRRSVALDEFFVDVFETILGPADIITGILIPSTPPETRFHYEKFLPRTVDDYATVSVAGRLDFDEDDVITGARVVLGAVGPVPIRATAVETMLAGANAAEIDVDAVAAEAAHAADPVDDARGSADYKREMTRVITARTLRRLLGTEVPN